MVRKWEHCGRLPGSGTFALTLQPNAEPFHREMPLSDLGTILFGREQRQIAWVCLWTRLVAGGHGQKTIPKQGSRALAYNKLVGALSLLYLSRFLPSKISKHVSYCLQTSTEISLKSILFRRDRHIILSVFRRNSR